MIKTLSAVTLIGFSLSPLSQVLAGETLQQGWQAALSANPEIKGAELDTAATQSLVKAAKAARLPVVELQGGYTALDNPPASKIQMGPTQTEMPVGEDRILSYSATASVPLYTGGRITHAIEGANQAYQAQTYQQRSTVQNLKLAVAQAYISVLRAHKAVELAQQQVDTLKAHLNDVQNMYDQNLVDRNDLLAAKTKLVDAEQQALQAHNALDLAKAQYNQLTNRSLDHAVELTELDVPAPAQQSLPELTQTAYAQRPELKALQANGLALHAQVKQTLGETKPQVFLQAGYDYQQNKYQVHEGKWQATLGVKWQLYDAGLTHYQADKTKKQANAIQQRQQDLKNKIALQVRQKWLSLQEAQKRIEVTQVGVEQANENLKVTRERYLSGLSSNTEVLDATTLKTLSDTHYYNARYDAILAKLELQYAIGKL